VVSETEFELRRERAQPFILCGAREKFDHDDSVYAITEELFRTRTAIVAKAHLDLVAVQIGRATDAWRGEGRTAERPGRALLAMKLYSFLVSYMKRSLPYWEREALQRELGVKSRYLDYAIELLEIVQGSRTVRGHTRKYWNVGFPETIDELVTDYVMVPKDAVVNRSLQGFDLWLLADLHCRADNLLVHEICDDLERGGTGRVDRRRTIKPRQAFIMKSYVSEGPPSSAGRDRRANALRRLAEAGLVVAGKNGYTLRAPHGYDRR
jgi:hypothetical protein